MIVTCPECLTKFRLEEERIPEGGARARCSKCQHLFQVQKPAPPEESFFSRGEFPGEFSGLEQDKGLFRSLIFRWKWAVLGLIVIGIVGGVILYLGSAKEKPFSWIGPYLSQKAATLKKTSFSIPFLKKYFGMGDQAEGFFSLEKVRGYYVENNNLSKIFVVEGEAVNHWKESRSFTKVKGTLLDSKGNKVREQEACCGNVLSEKDLKEMSRGAIEKSLSSQFGMSFSNVNILPNKSVPFMIAFLDLPPEGPQGQSPPAVTGKAGEAAPGLSDFTVEVTGSQRGSK